jgi:large subunit ribosomal protein L18
MSKRTSPREARRLKIKKRIRKRVTGTTERPRLLVYRSLKQIYAQLVDDSKQHTLCTVSSLSKTLREQAASAKGKSGVAKLVGKAIAEEAIKQNVKRVVFDRNGYLYHGRVKALADAAREAGLEF